MMVGGSHFRANAGAMIIDRDGDVLVFKRADVEDAWQMPQGGIDDDESALDAVLREVGEETGIPPDKLQLLAEAPDWLVYELPQRYRSSKTGRGQAQRWFLFRFLGDDGDIRPDRREFSAARWVDVPSLLKLAVDFRRPVYGRLVEVFRAHLPPSGPPRRPA